MSALTLPQTNGSQAVKPTDDWLQFSVRDFFSGLNWEDHPPDIQTIAQQFSEPSTEPLNLGMSVSKFFSAVNWDGAEIAAPVPIQSAPAQPPEEFTLDDFSGLF